MTMAGRAETPGGFLSGCALVCSVVGFLGFYSGTGDFVTVAPAVLVGVQLVLLGTALVFLRTDLPAGLAAVGPLLAVAGWAAATVIWANDPLLAGRRWLLVFVPSIMLAVAAAVVDRTERQFMYLVSVLAFVALASGLFSMIAQLFGDQIRGLGPFGYRVLDLGGNVFGVAEGGREYPALGIRIPRYSGLVSNPNGVGLIAGLAFVAVIAIAKPGFHRRGYMTLGVSVLLLAVVLASVSRSSWAMVCAGTAVVLLLRGNKLRLGRAVCALAVAFPFLVILYAVLSGAGPLPVLSESPNEALQLRERADVWRVGLAAAARMWLFGSGFGTVQEAVYAPLGLDTAAHSVPLTMVLETGIVGFVLVLFLWFRPVFLLTRRRQPLDGTAIGVVALLVALYVHQSVDSSVFRYHWAHFVFVYLIGIGAQLAAQHPSEEKAPEYRQ